MKQYVKETFSERRYEIWAMRSDFHNVPLVNGCVQLHGAGATGSDAVFVNGEDAATFGVDISSAYPPASGLVRWRRTSMLSRAARTVRIRDEFRFSRSENRYEQRFMTACAPRVVDGAIVLDIAPDRSVSLRAAPRPDRISLHAFTLEDGSLQRVWGEALYQVRLHYERAAAEGRCDIVLNVGHRSPGPVSASTVRLESGKLP
jgi:hypothetical protein